MGGGVGGGEGDGFIRFSSRALIFNFCVCCMNLIDAILLCGMLRYCLLHKSLTVQRLNSA